MLGRGVPLGALLAILAAAPVRAQDSGAVLFNAKCAACHTIDAERRVGPGLRGVTDRRSREWLTSFITHPDRMLAGGDSIAARLLAEYQIAMPSLSLTDEQAEALIGFLGAGPAGTGSAPVSAAALLGDAAEGRALFTGRRPLENGGPACISCHDAEGLGLLGGGTLGKDLTNSAATFAGGLAAVLETPPFPVMREVFPSHPLTPAEIAHLSAFLIDVGEGADPSRSKLWFPSVGTGGAIVLLALVGTRWRGRLRGVREPLVGDRR